MIDFPKSIENLNQYQRTTDKINCNDWGLTTNQKKQQCRQMNEKAT
jgi:hypothetical protein